ncbi:phage portal protein [Jannaschia formosa]|uniref:phage portal protein n=1 Tax=Jannaschia formosa TaxID=2259592 RepID=UPI000E1C248F|nr:phage portal protein [Jannaschia formosa]TFL16423.1 phage portal protein [Jannaschia formosa]
MSLLQKILAPFRARNQVDSSDVRRGDLVWNAFTGGLDGSPSERSAMRVTAVWACVSLISGAVASLPMHIYQRSREGDLSRDRNADLWWILNEQFSPRWSASAGWQFLVASKLLHGDGFAEILRGRGGQVAGLLPLHPDRVRVITTGDGARLIYEIQPDSTITRPSPAAAKIRVLDQDDMLHVPGFGFNGLRGMSALRFSLSNSGRLAINAQDFSSKFLENMARPDFALKSEKNLTDDQFKRLQDMLDKHRGPERAGKPMILEGGLGIQTLTMPLEEMQLLETRKFQVEEIARAFGVQPFMIGHTEKTSSWGTGVEAMGAGFVRYTLRDHLNAFQNEMNRKFFRTARLVAEFDTTELERADTKSMFDAVRIALGRAGEPAFMTLEEARELLRLPREMQGTIPETAAIETEETD